MIDFQPTLFCKDTNFEEFNWTRKNGKEKNKFLSIGMKNVSSKKVLGN